MARPHAVEDGEIGLGRQNDPSSSRESSPQRPHKRSFSPTSDDSDLVVPPIADDDTPPPLERPLLRQPVGFAWNNTSSISTAPPALNTYQASLPTASSSNSIMFLPGQEVSSLPPQVPKAKGSRPKTSDGKVTKKRRTAEYSTQTGRFRLDAYDPTPSEGPPLHHGPGPYSSLYRGTPSEATDRAFTAASPTPTLSSMGGGHTSSTSPAPNGNNAKTQSSAKRPKQIEGRAKLPTGKAKGSGGKKAKSSGQARASASSTRESTSIPANHESPAARNVVSAVTRSTAGGVHYRRDYESNTYAVDGHHSPGSPAHSPFSEPRNSEPRPSNTVATSSAADTIDPGVRRVLRQLRMVTLLIQDLRSGIADHQLAEVKIPLKAADDAQDGFWADAKELSEKLQASPARIDGPARAYTLRGKYRQFFLRVTAENVDEYISANLVVKTDRTLDVVVEKLPDPGTLPLPPQIPRDLRSPTPESVPSSPVPTDRQTFYKPLAGLTDDYACPSEIRPQRSPSAWSSAHSPSNSSYEPTAARRISASGSTSTATGPRKENRGYESPSSDEEPEELDKIISKAIDTLIQNDSDWIDFFRATAVPQRVSEVLKQYRFVQRMMEEWVGKRAPFRTHHHVVEAHHITRALHIDDPKYSSACTETLALLALYGPQGQYYEDDRIVAMINDTRDPEYNAKPIKRMLHLLQKIDRDWKNRLPPGTGSPGSAVSHVSGGE